jgi:WD40 repeat protein
MPDTPNFDKAALAWALPWDDDWVTAVAVLGPTRRVAAGNSLGQVLVWEWPEKGGAPVPVRRLDGHTNVISRLLATPDGRWLVSASYDHSVRLWDMSAATKGTAQVVPDARARAEAKKRGKKPPTEAAEITVGLQQAERVLDGHNDWVQGLDLTPDGKALASGDDGGQVIVREMPSGKELKRWKTKGWVYALGLSPDARLALVSERIPLVFDAGRLAAVKLWDVTTGQVARDLDALFKKEYQSAAAFSRDGKLVAVGRGGEASGPAVTVLLDTATGKVVRELKPGHEYGVTDLAFHPDGKHLASAGRDTVVRLWSLADGKLVKELGKPRGGQFKDWIHAISFAPDGRLLAAADMAGAVQVWTFPA